VLVIDLSETYPNQRSLPHVYFAVNYHFKDSNSSCKGYAEGQNEVSIGNAVIDGTSILPQVKVKLTNYSQRSKADGILAIRLYYS
jgi:hypothetical protein